MHNRFILPNENKKKFDLGLVEDENLAKLNEIARKQAFAHQKHQKIDAFERLVFEDFNSPLYASKSTISMNDWNSICDCYTIQRKLEYIDPRGYVNMSWLFLLGIITNFNVTFHTVNFYIFCFLHLPLSDIRIAKLNKIKSPVYNAEKYYIFK